MKGVGDGGGRGERERERERLIMRNTDNARTSPKAHV